MSERRTEVVKYLRQIAEGEPEVVLEMRAEASAPQAATLQLSDEAKQKAELLAEVENAAKVCTLCGLDKTRNKVVFGVGNPAAKLMFIGEAPGADEDRVGEPFVGRAGQLLTKIIGAMNLTREEVYIANILKCRPPGNRNPLPNESACCKPFLFKQIEIIDPKVMVALGLVAAINLLDLPPTTAMKDLRGKSFEFHGRPLIATYHPAALLRNPALKGPTWEDMKRVMSLLNGTAEDRPQN